jgi:hypothetical protein
MAERKANLLAAKTAKADKKVCDHPFILINLLTTYSKFIN